MSKLALVTGCFGFLGRHFRAELQRREYEVYGWDHPAHDLMKMIDEATIKPDLIIHAAVRNAWHDAITTQPGNSVYNTMLDAAMLDFAIKNEVEKFLYISSCAIYDNILSIYPFREKLIGHVAPDVYGAVKRHGETMADAARQCGVKVTTIRPFNIYGSDQTDKYIFGSFLRKAMMKADPFVIWGSLDQVRDFVHIDDVINGALALLDSEVQEAVNICTGIPTRIDTLAQMIISEVSSELKNKYTPTIEVDETMPMGVTRRIGDPSYLHRWYRPSVTLAEGIRRAIVDSLGTKR